MSRTPKTTFTLEDSSGDTQDSAHSPTQGEDLLQQKDTKQNQQREKAHGVTSGGNQARASESYPCEVTQDRTCLISPAKRVVTTHVKCCQPGGLSVQGFSWGPFPLTHSAWHVLKLHTPRRKAGIQRKPHCLQTL